MLTESQFLSLKTTHEQFSIFKSKRNYPFQRNRAACNTIKLQCNSSAERHFVLVHGACHGAWCWYKVSAILKAAGHDVSALDMAASGINPTKLEDVGSFSDYFEPLMEFMDKVGEEERVILVGHSMAGIGISLAMETFTRKISAAVFAAATMPSSHLSYHTIAAKYAEKSKTSKSTDTKFIFGKGPNNPPTALLLGPNHLASKLYRLSPPEDLELAMMLVRPFPIFSNAEARNEMIFTKKRHGSVPRIFIICDEENDEEQRWMVENDPPNEVKLLSGSDHMAMLSKPQELASYLLEIGQKY